MKRIFKYLLCALTLLTSANSQFIINPYAFGGAGPTYLVSEDFEGTGVPSGWTDTGSNNWDYSTSPAPLVGSQSLQNSADCYVDFTGQSAVWVYFTYYCPSTIAATNPWVSLQTSGGVDVAYLRSLNSGDLRGLAVTTLQTASAVETINQQYHIWLHYVKGTGANAVFQMYIATTDTRPGSPSVNISTGDATSDVARFRLFKRNVNSTIFDKIRISTSEIGSSPS